MSALKQSHQRITPAEVLFYATILALPFEELSTVGGGAITKWIGLAFVVVSLSEIRTFYKAFPPVFFFYLLYVTVGIAGDLFRIPLTLSLLNQSVGPALTCVFMIAAYNLAVNRGLQRLVFVLSLSASLLAMFQVSGLAAGVTNTYSQDVAGESMDRVSALSIDANFAACFMSLAALPGVLAVTGTLPMNFFYRVVSVLGGDS